MAVNNCTHLREMTSVFIVLAFVTDYCRRVVELSQLVFSYSSHPGSLSKVTLSLGVQYLEPQIMLMLV